MQPAERLEVGIVERLHADRDAIDARGAVLAKARCLSTLDGLASSVTSTSGAIGQCLAMASSTPATLFACISEGVPPPKKTERTVRPLVRLARWASSAAMAATNRRSSTACERTWLLKSQYGHFERQNGHVDVNPEARIGSGLACHAALCHELVIRSSGQRRLRTFCSARWCETAFFGQNLRFFQKRRPKTARHRAYMAPVAHP